MSQRPIQAMCPFPSRYHISWDPSAVPCMGQNKATGLMRHPCYQGKAGWVIGASSEDEEGEGQKPLESLVFIPGPALSSPGYLLPGTISIMVITAKAQYVENMRWDLSLTVQDRHCPVGLSFLTIVTQMTTPASSFISNPKEVSFNSYGTPPNYGAVIHFTGT